MDNNKKIERLTVDGRRAEVHTVEQSVEGATHRITEHFEEIVPLEKKKKVVERIVPVVVERVTEQFVGNQINKTVETIANEDPTFRLNLVPSNRAVTAIEVEDIVKRVVQSHSVPAQVSSVASNVATNTTNFFSNLFKKKLPHPIPHPVPVPVVPVPAAVSNASGVLVGYALISVLAIVVGFTVWQLFLR